MTDEEAIAKYEELSKYFNHNLPSLEHEPIRFAYYVKLFKYYNTVSTETTEVENK